MAIGQPSSPNRFLWVLLGLIIGAGVIAGLLNTHQESFQEVSYTDFKVLASNPNPMSEKIIEVYVQGQNLTGYKLDKSKVYTTAPVDTGFKDFLETNHVKITFQDAETSNGLKSLFLNMILAFGLCILGFWLYRSIQPGGGRTMSFGKSKAKMITDMKPKVTFRDIAGIDEAKFELQEIIEFLRDPKKFTKLGGRIPKGVLLIGPPGTGKTILAKGVAGEAGVPFFSISGSDFVEMFVGVGASRVRDLFEQAKKNAPCIIFIDEIDAVGRHRGAGYGGGHDEREQTLNQLLVEMDGFEANEGVIVVAATNRSDVLDSALLRPGRFDRRVHVPVPDIKGRLGILKVHCKKTPLADDVDLSLIAQATPGFTGADLENLINEASLIAARDNRKDVSMGQFESAKDKVLMGAERKGMIMSEKEKRNTAYHEAGHALIGLLTQGADPVHKVTIIPRGRALGVTIMLPEEDHLTMTKDFAEGLILYAMGGRAAEELIFGIKTTGAGDDLKKATDIAKKMVCNWGMNERIGPMVISRRDDEQAMYGRGGSSDEGNSPKLLEIIDEEVQKILSQSYDKAIKILRENQEKLKGIGEALLVKETLDAPELKRIINGEDIVTDLEREAYKTRVEFTKNWNKTPQLPLLSEDGNEKSAQNEKSQPSFS